MKRSTVLILGLSLVLLLVIVVASWKRPVETETKPATADSPAAAPVRFQTIEHPEQPPHQYPATVEGGQTATAAVAHMISDYHTRMKENPVGTNAEITRALLGDNPVHATFSVDAPVLNAKGEMLDPWGTPYFFHQLSADKMQVISAGPDKTFGTPDDIEY